MRFLSIVPVLALVMVISLSACQTIDNMTAELSKIGEPLSSDERRADRSQILCPKVTIVDELNSLTEFMDISDPSDYNLISHVDLTQLESSCAYKQGTVSVDLKLAFTSQLGVRGKPDTTVAPFFSYPFFVAVTNGSGQILAKEVFAASMTYDQDESSHTYYENLRQVIPIEDQYRAQNYQILIGFQLSEDQLAYNRRVRQVQGKETPENLEGTEYRPLNVTPTATN